MESVKTNCYFDVELGVKFFGFRKMIEQKRERLNKLRQSKYINIYQDNPIDGIMNGLAAFVNETQIWLMIKSFEQQTLL